MRTAARDASTRAAAACRSGFRSTASSTSAVSSESPKVRIQFGTTGPLRCGALHSLRIFARALAGMMLAPAGGFFRAHPACMRHAMVPGRMRYFMRRALVKLEDEPVNLGRDAHEDLADDVNHLPVLGVDRAGSHRACGEEEILVPRFDQKPDRDAVLEQAQPRCGSHKTADGHLALCRGPHD